MVFLSKLLLGRALLAAGFAYKPPRRGRAAVVARRCEDVDDPAMWERWSALEETGVATAFQSRAFVEPLLRRLASAQGLRPFVVEVCDAAGPLMAAAFVRRRRHGAVVVELADCGVSDYAGPILRADADLDADAVAAVEAAVLAALPPHDALVLRRMPETIGGRRNPLAAFSGVQAMCAGTLAVDAAATVAAAPRAVKEPLRRMRKLIRDGGTVRRIACEAEAAVALERLFAIRDRTKRVQGAADTVADPAVRAFYRAVIPPAAASGFAAVYEIATADRVLAVVQGFVYRGRFHGTLMGFAADDPASAAYAPGLVGVVKALEDHARIPGGIFDFGAGGQAYKARFGGTPSRLVQVSHATTLLGLAPLAADSARRAARRLLGAHPALGATVRRALRR